MTPTSSLQWTQMQEAFAAGDVLANNYKFAFAAAKVEPTNQQATAMQPQIQAQPLMVLLDAFDRYNSGERGLVELQLAEMVPVLVQIGLFNLFSPAEWMSSDNAARRLVGLFAKQYLAGPQK